MMLLKAMYRLIRGAVLLKYLTVALPLLSFFVFDVAAHAAAPSCSQVFTESKSVQLAGALFLHERDSKLHVSSVVEKQVQIQKRVTGQSLQKPADKLNLWLRNLEEVSEKLEKSSWALDQVKAALYNQHVIKINDVPKSYYDLQVKMARERGHGDMVLTASQKMELAEIVVKDQEKSLEPWIEFLVSPDMRIYPMWAKYWMFSGMTKLSKLNLEEASFSIRSKETVAPYPELNREAVGMVMELILKRLDKKSLEEIKDPKLQQLLQTANFGKMYGHVLKALGESGLGRFHTNEGKWIVYKQGSDETPLVRSLEGQNTGWCTASPATARRQLDDGDFHVYYSLDKQGQPTVPRLAIRMQSYSIGEIRGVGEGQNFDSQIAKSNVLSTKLKEFGSAGKIYEVRDHDMRLLTEIERKDKMGLPLTKEDLRFLYEWDRAIQGFGHKTDPRIIEIKAKRDLKSDYVTILDGRYTKEDISLTTKEWLSNRTKVLMGDLDVWSIEGVDLTKPSELKLPEFIRGNLSMKGIKSAIGLQLPEMVTGNIDLSGLNSASGLKLPATLKGVVDLSGLQSAVGLNLPTTIEGSLHLGGLTSTLGLKLPETIGGSLSLVGLTSASGLTLPKTIGGSLYLSGLTSSSGLNLPQTIGGSLSLSGLTLASGLKLPEVVEGSVYLTAVTSALGMKLPRIVGGNLNLNGLTSSTGLRLPETIEGSLNLRGLTEISELKLPTRIGGSLDLSGLTVVSDLKLPEAIGQGLYLGALTTASKLVLPRTVGEDINLGKLTSAPGLKLPETIGGILFLRDFPSAKGLKLPPDFDMSMYAGPTDFAAD